MRLQIKSALGGWSLGAIAYLSAALASAQAPVIDATQSANAPRSKPASAAPANAGSAAGELLLQVQSLQQEVMELRGIVEEQAHQIQNLKQQGFDRYNDLDQRLNRLQGGAPAAAAHESAPIDASATPVAPDSAAATSTAATGAAAPAPAPSAAPVAAPAPTGQMETAKPEEYEAYQIAYAKLKGQDFNGAIKAFNAFLTTYPHSPLAANSYYWLGKAHLLVQPQDLNKAQVAFTKVGEFPQSNKVPDALYELGKVYFLKGDKPRAKSILQQVIDNYGASGSSAPQLAKQFLDQNFPAAKR